MCVNKALPYHFVVLHVLFYLLFQYYFAHAWRKGRKKIRKEGLKLQRELSRGMRHVARLWVCEMTKGAPFDGDTVSQTKVAVKSRARRR